MPSQKGQLLKLSDNIKSRLEVSSCRLGRSVTGGFETRVTIIWILLFVFGILLLKGLREHTAVISDSTVTGVPQEVRIMPWQLLRTHVGVHNLSGFGNTVYHLPKPSMGKCGDTVNLRDDLSSGPRHKAIHPWPPVLLAFSVSSKCRTSDSVPSRGLWWGKKVVTNFYALFLHIISFWELFTLPGIWKIFTSGVIE